LGSIKIGNRVPFSKNRSHSHSHRDIKGCARTLPRHCDVHSLGKVPPIEVQNEEDPREKFQMDRGVPSEKIKKFVSRQRYTIREENKKPVFSSVRRGFSFLDFVAGFRSVVYRPEPHSLFN